jgi:hypothetical protein
MSTPIEIVREQMHAERARYNYCATSAGAEYYTALASVLRDAERLAKLEDAYKKEELICVMVPDPHADDLWALHDGTLAELADRLRTPNTNNRKTNT